MMLEMHISNTMTFTLNERVSMSWETRVLGCLFVCSHKPQHSPMVTSCVHECGMA
jgi:hypothetical protein